jgi:aldehyde reductase
MHWPMSYLEDGDNFFPKDANGEFIDGNVDYIDTWKAMEKLVDAGLTRSIGVSNFNAHQIDRLVANGKETLPHFPRRLKDIDSSSNQS